MPFNVATTLASSRAFSEDRVALHPVAGGLLVVVADGAGGFAGGGRAADLALELVARAVETAAFPLFLTGSWVELLDNVDHRIASDGVAGETTLVVVGVTEDGCVVGASCGDSGAWIIGDDGVIDELTAMQRRRRLGSGRAKPVAFERAALRGTLVVATDGLFSYAGREPIASIVAGHEELDAEAVALVEAVRLRSGSVQDDVAVVLVRGTGYR